jgi:predicted HTH transcriptional regulator
MLFSDRLEVWNPAELPAGRTISSLSRPHPSMIARCRKAGLAAPQFRQDIGQFVQTIPRAAAQVTPQVTSKISESYRGIGQAASVGPWKAPPM